MGGMRAIAAAAVLLLSLTVPGTAVAAGSSGTGHASASSSGAGTRIYGGASTAGNPAVIAVAMYDHGVWSGQCSAVMFRPRVILTAAHCVTKSGTAAGVDGFAVFPPGAVAVVYSNTGPRGAAPASVRQWWAPAGYVNGTGRVQPNDIAVVLLDSDLGPGAYTRLATTAELTRWATEGAAVQHLGYGLTGPGVGTNVPHSVQLPLVSFSRTGSLGSTFATAQSSSQGVCPGDSGGPVLRAEGAATYLLGVQAGSNSPCQNPPSSTTSNVSLAAMQYLDIINQGLTAAGYAPIPSAPQSVTAAAVNRDVTVTWQPPAVAPDSVVGYDVLDASGAVVCQSTTTSCTVPGLPDGRRTYTVRSRNVDGEGDALPPTATAAVVPPPTPSKPRVSRDGDQRIVVRFGTLAGQTSATVSEYVVTDDRGRPRCAVTVTDASADRLACSFRAKPGTYRLQVTAVTGMGVTAPSAPSRPVRIPA